MTLRILKHIQNPLDFELIPKAEYVYSPEMKEHDYAAYAVFFYC